MEAAKERVKERPKETSQASQYLSFFIAGEEYGVGILRVKEILQFEGLTRVPTTPPWIRGVINLRGAVVPVVDLAVMFGLPETAITKWTCVVIVEIHLEGEPTVMGIMVDSVSQVIDLSAEDIQPTPPFGTRVRVDFLIGMGRAGQKFVLLLDIDKVLSFNQLIAAELKNLDASAASPEGEAQEASAEEPPGEAASPEPAADGQAEETPPEPGDDAGKEPPLP